MPFLSYSAFLVAEPLKPESQAAKLIGIWGITIMIDWVKSVIIKVSICQRLFWLQLGASSHGYNSRGENHDGPTLSSIICHPANPDFQRHQPLLF